MIRVFVIAGDNVGRIEILEAVSIDGGQFAASPSDGELTSAVAALVLRDAEHKEEAAFRRDQILGYEIVDNESEVVQPIIAGNIW